MAQFVLQEELRRPRRPQSGASLTIRFPGRSLLADGISLAWFLQVRSHNCTELCNRAKITMQLGLQEVLRCGQAKSPSSSQLNARLFPCCAAARARRAACGLRGEHVRALRRGVPDDVGPGLPHEDAPLQEGGEGRSGAGGAGRWDRRGGEVSDILAHVEVYTEWKLGHFIIRIY